MDEETRKDRARVFIERSPWMFAVFATVVAIGSFFAPLPAWRVLVLCFCGVLDTKLQLNGFRAADWRKSLLSGGSPIIFGAIALVDSDKGSFLQGVGVSLYAMACGAATSAILCCLFREPFLRYAETPLAPVLPPDYPAVECDSAPVDVVVSHQTYDY